MEKRLVHISVAPNGARLTQADHPALPLTPAALAEEAAACFEAGASFLHLHARDEAGRHSLEPAPMRAVLEAVAERVGPTKHLQITTEQVGRYDVEAQMALVEALKPQGASLALREFMTGDSLAAGVQTFFQRLDDWGTLPQYILYTPEDVTQFLKFRGDRIIPDHHDKVLFVLGKYAPGQVSAPRDLLPFLAAAGSDLAQVQWTVCAFGPREQACAMAAAALGGHARIGFENNLYLANGDLAPSNAALVQQLAAALPSLGCQAAGLARLA